MKHSMEALKAEFVENIPVSFCIIQVLQDEEGSPVDFVFKYVNQAHERLEGRSKAQMLDHSFYEVFPNADRKWLHIYGKTAFEGISQRFEDYSPEIDKYLKIMVYQLEEGVCGCLLEDVTDKYHLQKERQKQDIIRNHILKEAADVIFYYDPNKKIIHNHWYKGQECEVFASGMPFPEGLLEKGYVTDKTADTIRKTMARMEKQDIASCEIESKLPENDFWQWYRLTFLVDENIDIGKRRIIGYLKNDHEAIRKRHRLERKANADALTELWNRSKGMVLMDERCRNALSKENPGAFFMLDIDDFKRVNDRYGHAVGDDVLRFVADSLTGIFLSRGIVCRMGGDEFAAFIENIKTEQDAENVCRKIQQKMKEYPAFAISCSIGVYLSDQQDSADAFYEKADDCLYQAKEAGKAGYFIFSEFQNEQDTVPYKSFGRNLASDIQQAMNRREIKAYYQPQYDAVTSRMVGAEALVRWIRPDGTVIMPGSFIPQLERENIIHDLDWYMLREVCTLLCSQRKEGVNCVPISINFSRRHICEKNFVKKLCEMADQYEVPHWLIEVEITESAFAEQSETIAAWTEAIRAEGFRVAIDDFGSGLSSLSFVKDMDVDTLKIDRSLLNHNCEDEKERIVLESIFNFAHRLHLKTVAEGVETREQLSFLRTCSCKVIQGYLFAKPMPEEKFRKLCGHHDKVEEMEDILMVQAPASATQLLLEAVFARYTLIIFSNLTRNSYYMMAYEDFTTRTCPSVGVFDELIEGGTSTMHPEDKELFYATFNRSSLMDAYNRGEKSVRAVTRQLGDDGIYRSVETVDYFVKNSSVDDVLVITLCHNQE